MAWRWRLQHGWGGQMTIKQRRAAYSVAGWRRRAQEARDHSSVVWGAGRGTRAAGGREKQHHHGGRHAAGGRAPARCMWASNSNNDKQQGQLRSGEPPRQTGQNRKSMI